jgi:hypothetical protein
VKPVRILMALLMIAALSLVLLLGLLEVLRDMLGKDFFADPAEERDGARPASRAAPPAEGPNRSINGF